MALFDEESATLGLQDENIDEDDDEELVEIDTIEGETKREGPRVYLSGNDRKGERALTKYERAKLISLCAVQIQQGAKIPKAAYFEILVSQLVAELPAAPGRNASDAERIVRDFLKNAEFRNFKEARDRFSSIYGVADFRSYSNARSKSIYSAEKIARLLYDMKLINFTRKNYDATYENWKLSEMVIF
jgi:hypothetical protein